MNESAEEEQPDQPGKPDLFKEIADYLKKDREKSPTDKVKGIAGAQLDALGYGNFPQRLLNFIKGMGIESTVDKLLPNTGQDKVEDFIEMLINQMERIPDNGDARNILKAATFGVPLSENPDGTITVSSFTLAEPSKTTVQRYVDPKGVKGQEALYEADIRGTDALLRKLMVEMGFAENNDTAAELVFGVKKLGSASLRSGNSEMVVRKPKAFELESKSRTPYAYQTQTILTNTR